MINDRVQKLSPQGQFVTEWNRQQLGGAQAHGVAVDAGGHVYVTTGDMRVRKLWPGSEQTATFGGAPGDAPLPLQSPQGIHLDASGRIWVASSDNHSVVRFDASGAGLVQLGMKQPAAGNFRQITDVAVDHSGNVYVADEFNIPLQKFTAKGRVDDQWKALAPSGKPLAAKSMWPDAAGNLYAADFWSRDLLKLSRDGKPELVKTLHGRPGSEAIAIRDLVVHPGGAMFFVDETGDDSEGTIWKFSSTGEPLAHWGSIGPGRGQFRCSSGPAGIGVDAQEVVYALDSCPYTTEHSPRILRFSSSGEFLGEWGTRGSKPGEIDSPLGIAVDSHGGVYLTDSQRNRVLKFTATGQFLGEWGSRGTGPGQFQSPGAIAVDKQSTIYVADVGNGRIQMFRPE